MPDGKILDSDQQTVTSGSNTTAGADHGRTTTRMIDWSMTLKIHEDDLTIMNLAAQKMRDYKWGVNQSQSYIKTSPIFLDIEVKRSMYDRDPRVQLSIWAAGALLKRRHHGWDTQMPMPAIAIYGDRWEYFISFEVNKDLVGLPLSIFCALYDRFG